MPPQAVGVRKCLPMFGAAEAKARRRGRTHSGPPSTGATITLYTLYTSLRYTLYLSISEFLFPEISLCDETPIWTEVWPTRPTPPSFINQAARDGAYFDRERRAGARDQILYNKDLHAESINERD